MVMMSRELSNKIANVGFICACLVVLIHVPALENGFWLNDFVFKWIKTGMCGVAVPTFFIISGFLLGRHVYEENWYRDAIRKRVKSLVVPFFALNMLWYPVKYSIHKVGVMYFGADGSNHVMDFTVQNFLYFAGFCPWGGNAVVGLWYVRVLFYLVLVSPVLVWFIRKGVGVASVFLLSLLGLMCLQASAGNCYGACTFTFNLKWPLFFSIGIACAMYAPKNLPKFVTIASIPLAVFMLIIFKQEPFSDASLSSLFEFVATLLISLALWGNVSTKKWSVHLTGNSFPIFVLHSMILYLLPIPMKAAGVWDKVLIKVGFLPIWGLTIILAIVISEFLKKYLPRFSMVLFGGR